MCGVIVINVIARKERSPVCAVKKLPFLGGEKFAVNVNKSSDFTNIGLSVFLKVGISVS